MALIEGLLYGLIEGLKNGFIHPDFHRYFSYVFFFIVLYVLRGYFWEDRRDLIKKLKGDNGEWDSLEVAFTAWIICFVTAILATLFFGLDMPGAAWMSLDTVGLFVLAGKKGPDVVMALRGRGFPPAQERTIVEEHHSTTKVEQKGGTEAEPGTVKQAQTTEQSIKKTVTETKPLSKEQNKEQTEKKGGLGSGELDNIGTGE